LKNIKRRTLPLNLQLTVYLTRNVTTSTMSHLFAPEKELNS